MLPLANKLGYLDDDVPAVQLKFVPILNVTVLHAVRVSDEGPIFVVHHHPPVECVEFEAAILPSLVFALQVAREEADVLNYRGGGAGADILRGKHDSESKS